MIMIIITMIIIMIIIMIITKIIIMIIFMIIIIMIGIQDEPFCTSCGEVVPSPSLPSHQQLVCPNSR